jgi:hypothetical protein
MEKGLPANAFSDAAGPMRSGRHDSVTGWDFSRLWRDHKGVATVGEWHAG